jgi:NADPH:quinone reductase-like Zn-dependent oxidoreductase
MKAIVYTRYGPPDVLRYTDVEIPPVGDEDVLVRVHAASLNFGDRAAVRGSPWLIRLAMGLRRPRATIPGRDIAGTVEAVGPRVTRFQIGDRVFGEVNQRGFAESVAAPQDRLTTIPAGVSFAQAATLPVAATTARQAMRLGQVREGHTVLVNGASGGVGTFAVQLAKLLGAQVTGVCSARNADLVRTLGADHVIDYRRVDITTGPRRYDVIVDLAGGHRVSAMRRLLTPTGVYLASTGSGGPVLGPVPRILAATAVSPFVRQRLRVLVARADLDDFAYLADLVATGKLAPVIERTCPLAETADAIRRIEAEHARGKVVITIPD